MHWLTSKTMVIAGSCLALFGLQGYGLMSMRNTMDDRVNSMQRELQTMRTQESSKVSQLASDLDVVTKRMGITSQELQQARTVAERLKQENAQATQRLRQELAGKADSEAVNQYR